MSKINNDGENLEGKKNSKSSGGKSGRGFAAMDPELQRKIASAGGKAAHEKGTAHVFTSKEAREAGRKGGVARSRKKPQRSATRPADR